MRISADCIDQEVAVKNPQPQTNDTNNNRPSGAASSIQEVDPSQQQRKTSQVSGKQSNICTAMESGRHIGVVVQKDDAKNTRRNSRKTIKIPFPDATIPWCCFRSRLLQACNIKPGSDVEIVYLDEEEDKIHINSEDEFFEAMRVAEHMNPFIIFVKEMDSAMRANKLGSDARKPRSFTVISDACTCDSDSENDDDFQQNDLNSSLSNFDTSTPPVWFEAYMKTMEANIVSKISQEMEQMMTTVLQILKQDEKKKTEKQTFSDSAEKVEGPLHAGIVCDNCERLIRGIRYKCEVCEDFDLCMKCEAIPGVHTKGHMFLKITEPVQTRTIRCIPFFRPKQANACAVNQSDDQQAAANAQPPLFPMTKTEPNMTYGFRSGKNERKMAKMMKKIAKRSVSHPLQIKVRSSSSSALPGQEAWTAGRRNTDPNIEKDGCRISFPPFMDAQFIDDGNVPDGKVMQPGERFVKCWKVCNSGTKRWNSHTVLRCWGSSGLIPKSKEVPVPHLRPGEEGIISVHFLAPSKPGRYQSHWRFYHRNNVFGHHLWCNIEVASPAVLQGPPATAPAKNAVLQLSSEKEADQLLEAVPPAPVDKMNKKPTEVTEDIAQALSVVQVEQENGQLGGRKKVLISHTTTPTNTPFDMTPPKSPEPHPKEQQKPSTPVDKLDLTAADKADVSSDGEDTASVLSLSSSDSDTEFVVIPVPSSSFSMVPQFNKSPTAIASDQLSCSQYSLTSTDTFEMVRRKNSSGSGNGEEDTFKKSTVSEHPASSSTSSDITTAESSGGEECLRGDAIPACLAVAAAATAELPSTEDERLSVTDDVKCGLDGGGSTAKDSALNNVAQTPEKVDNAMVSSQEPSCGSNSASTAVNAAVTSAPVTPAVTTATSVEVSMPTGAVSESPTQTAVASPSTKSSAVSNINPQAYTQAVLNQQSARTIDVLPEGLMTGALSAAATVYNTTRELFSSIQRQTEPPAEIIRLLQPGTYYTAPVWSPPPPPPPPPPPADTPMGHLVEMGFCNVALNESLLEKHKGNLSEVVAELIATSDNDWFTHRHRPEPTINFD